MAFNADGALVQWFEDGCASQAFVCSQSIPKVFEGDASALVGEVSYTLTTGGSAVLPGPWAHGGADA